MGRYTSLVLDVLMEASIQTLLDRSKGRITDNWFKWTSRVPSGYEHILVYYLDTMKNGNVKVLWIDGNKVAQKSISRPTEYTVIDEKEVSSKIKDKVNSKL